MNATRIGFTLGVRRTRGIALALMLLALLASGAAGYFIRAVTSPTARIAQHTVVVAPSAASSNPAGARWWEDAAVPSGAVVSIDAWWKDMH